MRAVLGFLGVCTLAACGGGDGGGTIDAGPDRPAWSRTLPESTVMGERRGLTPARGIIHLHSPYSHDACDGDPKLPDGTINEDCLADLKRGLCDTAMAFAALTDHDDSMADVEWGGEIFVARGEDQLIYDDGGSPIASRVKCADGHTLLLFVGGENDLMPIMLDAHPPGDAAARHDWYNGNTPQEAAEARGLGGLAWVAHGESKDAATIQAQGLDGMEIYNLHANIDPDIREEYLGLSGAEAITEVVKFADQSDSGPEPDLAILAFLSENGPALETWQTLLAGGMRIWGSAGTDAHQNALPIELRDGERGDSYRRMMRWFSNVALVSDAEDPAAIQAAIAAGRFFVAFEVFGTPVGFDARVELDDGSVVELGGAATLAAGAEIVATTPSIHALLAELPAPAITTRILLVDGAVATEVASGSGEVRHVPAAPGVYRVEVRITPRHLRPYLGKLADEGRADQTYVWIYANPFFIE